MTTPNFHFAIQLFKFIFKPFKRREMSLQEKLQLAISTGKPCTIEFVKEGTGEVTTRKASTLKKSSKGTILFQDLEKQALRSFIPTNLKNLSF